MQITPSGLSSIYFNLRVAFQEGYARPPSAARQLATEMPSTTAENRYAWLSRIPRLREWVGERILRNVASNVYALRNKDFEDTLEIDRNDIEDDNLSMYPNLASMLGEAASRWPDELIAAALKNGAATSALAFDGQPFFNASHPISPTGQTTGTYSNLFTSLPLTAANFETARVNFASYTGEDAKPLGVRVTHIIVPSQLGQKARTILNAELITETVTGEGVAAITNVNKGVAQIIELEELNDQPTTWYVADLSKGIKPLIFQNRRGANLVALTNPSDPNVFFHKKFIYGVDTRGAAGYSLPFLIAKCTA